MGDILLTSSELNFEEILLLFKLIYNLPKFSEQIKDTLPDTEERNTKLTELKEKILHIYSLFKQEEFTFVKDFNSSNYPKQVDILKNKLIDKIKIKFPEISTYLIINEIHTRLNSQEIKICEELMHDMVHRSKEDSMKRDVKNLLENMFKKYDQNGNGKISLEELENTIKNYGLPSLIANEIMTHADLTKDGEICYNDFEQYTEQHVLKYYKIFYNLDSDNDMKLNFKQTRQSLHEIYPNLEFDQYFFQIFDMMDKDRTGLITFEEWCEFLIFFPQRNLQHMVDQWRLFAVTKLDPLEPDSSFVEKDIDHGTSASYIEIVKTFICGGIAGGFSRTVTAPLERLKVLYMTMYTDSKPPSIWKGLIETYDKKGIFGLFRGNSVSIMMSVLEQALRFTIIDYSKKKFEDSNGYIKPHDFFIIGMITGVLSTLVLFPLDVVRIRVISSHGEKNKVYNKVVKIYTTLGLRGFYSGLTPHLISVLPAGSFNVVFYNLLKRLFITQNDYENTKLHKFMLIGGSAALITGTVTYPFSLLTSRLIVTNKNAKNYSERVRMVSMITSIIRNEGFYGFFKGYNASTLRLIIGQSVNFGTYEKLKSYLSIPNAKKKENKK